MDFREHRAVKSVIDGWNPQDVDEIAYAMKSCFAGLLVRLQKKRENTSATADLFSFYLYNGWFLTLIPYKYAKIKMEVLRLQYHYLYFFGEVRAKHEWSFRDAKVKLLV